ncbi:hypothetical protein ABT173_24135 [Streptomyces sp. NPDC001795]|uniref:hypothetical protein n=1 Tax=Streptomyces sp. NPDC001795 TaxID=3154525 RepID=UPI0033262BCA
MSRLSESVSRVLHLLGEADLAADRTVARLLDETTARRSPDLSDPTPQEQATLIEGRSVNLIPSASALVERIETARAAGRPLVVKYGIDPTSADPGRRGGGGPARRAGRERRPRGVQGATACAVRSTDSLVEPDLKLPDSSRITGCVGIRPTYWPGTAILLMTARRPQVRALTVRPGHNGVMAAAPGSLSG